MSATLAARAHSSSTLSAPAGGAPARRAGFLSGFGRLVRRRPGRAFLLLAFGGVAAMILVNALMFQKVRHPAPIASAPSTTTPARAVERRAETPPAAAALPPAQPVTQASAPIPPARPSALPPAAREAAPRPPAAVTSVPRTAAAPALAAPAPATRTAAAPRDPIADLINGVDMRPPGEIRGPAQAKPATARRTVEN